jgi:hypothetical protein
MKIASQHDQGLGKNAMLMICIYCLKQVALTSNFIIDGAGKTSNPT